MTSAKESIDSFYGEYKRPGIFGKKSRIRLYLYNDKIEGSTFELNGGVISKDTSHFDIQLIDIKDISQRKFDGTEGICITYKTNSVVSGSNASIVFLGLDDNNKWITLINKARDTYFSEQQKKLNLDIQKKEEERLAFIEKEEKAKLFYDECYRFHINPNTPNYHILKENNKIVLMYIDESKSLCFLKIDGYAKEENTGVISYKNIHYYEKAGSVSYVSDIIGNYSSYGGSFTGANFSKLAAVGGGLLFGLMGMAFGSALTYKPSQYIAPQVDIDIDTEIKKIDDRNVILNFYSESKKQYVDIELPQDIYNFLQTYLPEKKYGIVDELEKKTVVNQSTSLIENGDLLRVSANPVVDGISSTNANISMNDFKLKIEKLKMMKESGLLTDDEFEEEKKKLISQI